MRIPCLAQKSAFVVVSLLLIQKPVLAENACREVPTAKPPFYLTDVKVNKVDSLHIGEGRWSGRLKATKVAGRTGKGGTNEVIMERLFRNERGGKAYRFLARNSLVQAFQQPDEAAENSKLLVRVKVLNANTNYEQYLADPSLQAKDNQTGFLPYNALTKTDHDTILVLRRDSPLMLFPELKATVEKNGVGILRPIMVGDKFKAVLCAGSNEYHYLFGVYNPEKSDFTKTLPLRPEVVSCFDPSVISKNSFEDLRGLQDMMTDYYHFTPKLDDFEINEWGRVRLPMKDEMPDPVNAPNVTRVSYDGSFVHFNGWEKPGTDDWLDPQATCGFLRVMEKWKKRCKAGKDRCLVQVGDCSFMTPGVRTGSTHDPLGHHTHFSGHCMDIRPFRTDGALDGTTRKEHGVYDHELTKEFISLLIEEGATPIYFNDPKILKDPELGEGIGERCLGGVEGNENPDLGKKVKACSGHDNHVHVCFYEPNNKGCSK